ncbi:ABC transporter permease [Dorea sp. D27]|uniref:ABC transporter permease n=1 Tax=Dorea sp. D27 TaxID=658665 RepID=UPI0018DCF16A|nr:FtsX-like permease family protein [Dorea sp. D27]
MGILKRACLYITRKKVRTIIMFTIIMSMSLFMLAGISIRFGASEAAADIRKTISTGLVMNMGEIPGDQVFQLVPNEKGEMVRTLKVPLLTRAHLAEILDIDGVEGYYTNQGFETAYTGLKLHPGGYTSTVKEAERQVSENRPGWTEEDIASNETSAHANGFYIVNEGKWHPFFRNGALELAAGRHIEEGDRAKAVISEELAERNGLQIGDEIEAYNFELMSGERYGSAYKTEIVGIFKINFQQDLSNWTSEDQILANVIFTDSYMRYWAQSEYNTYYGRQVLGRESYDILDNITLYVEDPMMLGTVKETLMDIGSVDWSYYSFKEYDRDYKAAAGPLNKLIRLSTILAAVMAAGLAVVLSLVLAIWMRSRQQEIGILSSLGITRRGILAQIVLECCIIAVIAFVAAGVLAGPVTAMADERVSVSVNKNIGKAPYEVEINEQSGSISVNKMPSERMASGHHLTPEAAGIVFFVILVVTVISVIISCRRIIGKRPKIF